MAAGGCLVGRGGTMCSEQQLAYHQPALPPVFPDPYCTGGPSRFGRSSPRLSRCNGCSTAVPGASVVWPGCAFHTGLPGHRNARGGSTVRCGDVPWLAGSRSAGNTEGVEGEAGPRESRAEVDIGICDPCILLSLAASALSAAWHPCMSTCLAYLSSCVQRLQKT